MYTHIENTGMNGVCMSGTIGKMSNEFGRAQSGGVHGRLGMEKREKEGENCNYSVKK